MGRRRLLFDAYYRIDATHATSNEDSFSFLNRAAGPYWERVRELLESLFAEYPPEHAADLRARFRDRRWELHVGAWWELYLYSLFRALDAEVTVHPDMPGVSTHPDFEVRVEGQRFYVEARFVRAGLTSGPQEGSDGWITGPLDTLTHAGFMVSVRILQRSAQQPRAHDVTAGVLDWLDGLDTDVDLADRETFEGRAGGWRFLLKPIPMKASARARGLVGVFPGLAGWDNTVDAFRGALKAKASRYGTPDAPYLVALLTTSGFLDVRDVATALYGARDETGRRSGGFWGGSASPRHTRVSGILVGDALLPWLAGARLPRLWSNPSASRELQWRPGLSTGSLSEAGEVRLVDATLSPRDVFGLSPDWPGPEAPFGE